MQFSFCSYNTFRNGAQICNKFGRAHEAFSTKLSEQRQVLLSDEFKWASCFVTFFTIGEKKRSSLVLKTIPYSKFVPNFD